MKKNENVIIYSDENYYSAFPSVVSRADGELIVAFRRAPDRRKQFATRTSHTDPNSYLVLVRSGDGGRNWSEEPELIYAHPFGGSQDPCMVQLDDGSLLVTSYAWMLLPEEGIEHQSQLKDRRGPGVFGWTFTFLGGYLLKSHDAGRRWNGPFYPPQLENETSYFPGIQVPAMNRGAMVQARDGILYWVACRTPKKNTSHPVLDLLVSKDRGVNWEYLSPVASDDRSGFNETSLVETRNGDLVAFVRTESLDDHGVIVRSTNLGKDWEPWQDMGIIGHPYHGLRLPDDRIFLVYGYRHEPYGIRARVLDPDCTDFSGEEIVLRDDGGTRDLGYPWSCLTEDGRILVVYYINQNNGTRQIAGTFVAPD